ETGELRRISDGDPANPRILAGSEPHVVSLYMNLVKFGWKNSESKSGNQMSFAKIRGKAIRVLLLEDNPADAHLCLHRLKASDFSAAVDVARNPEQFKDFVAREADDIVLADYRLPDSIGREVFRWFGASEVTIPFIVDAGA